MTQDNSKIERLKNKFNNVFSKFDIYIAGIGSLKKIEIDKINYKIIKVIVCCKKRPNIQYHIGAFSSSESVEIRKVIKTIILAINDIDEELIIDIFGSVKKADRICENNFKNETFQISDDIVCSGFFTAKDPATKIPAPKTHPMNACYPTVGTGNGSKFANQAFNECKIFTFILNKATGEIIEKEVAP